MVKRSSYAVSLVLVLCAIVLLTLHAWRNAAPSRASIDDLGGAVITEAVAADPKMLAHSEARRQAVIAADEPDVDPRTGAKRRNWMEGRVRDRKGAPISGASIVEGDAEVQITDDTGAFGFVVDDRTREVTLFARAPGYAWKAFICEVGREESVVLSEGVRVIGRIAYADATVGGGAGQRLRWKPANTALPWQGLVCDSRGEFVFWALEGDISIEVDTREGIWRELVLVRPPETYCDIQVGAATVRLDVAVRVEGIGTPLSGAQVYLDDAEQGLTDAAGRIELAVYPEQQCSVQVRAAGYASCARVVQAPKSGELEVVLEMVEEARVYGRVVSPNGDPVQGTEVQLMVRRPRGVAPKTSGIVTVASTKCTTDDHGRFSFGSLGSNYGRLDAQLIAVASDFARYESRTFVVQNGSDEGPITIELQAAGAIWGIITSNGRPEPAVVSIEGAQRRVVTVGESGAFDIGNLPAGSWEVSVYLQQHVGIFAHDVIELSVGDRVQRDFALDVEWHPIWGAVRDRSGAPVADALVCCESESLNPDKPAVYSSRTGVDGRYEVIVPVWRSTGEPLYSVHLRRWDGDSVQDSVRPPARVDIECGEAAILLLRAVDANSGNAIREVYVAWVPDEDPDEALTLIVREPEGDVRSVEVPSGSGKLIVEAPDYETWRRSLTVSPGQPTEVLIEMSPRVPRR